MTMHLERGLTTINTKKRKRKITKAKIEKWTEELRLHNKHMKKLGMHSHIMTIDEYVDYVHGQYKPKKKTETVMNTPWHYSGPVRRETKEIPSHNSDYSFAPATKKEPMWYTGDRKLVGIAMMHKSNLVPVFADDDDKTGSKQATEYAQMRRN
jgi:hypothetical protein